jgi:hypothetical protein
MAHYVHEKTGTEFTTGMLIFTMVILVTLGWIGAGAIAAIPAFLGAVDAALWVWGILGGMWTGSMFLGLKQYKSESSRVYKLR